MLVANPKKFQMMLLGTDINQCFEIKIENFLIKNSNSVELLDIVLDSNLSFEAHILGLCQSANYNVMRLNRIRKFITYKQSLLLFNAFIISYFMYAPIVWMFCSKTLYQRINKVFRRGVIILNSVSPEADLPVRSPTSIHELHLRQLLSEVFKSQNSENPLFMAWLFPSRKISYNLRSTNLVSIPKNVLTVRHGFNSFPFRASILWNKLPDEIKNSKDISNLNPNYLDSIY